MGDYQLAHPNDSEVGSDEDDTFDLVLQGLRNPSIPRGRTWEGLNSVLIHPHKNVCIFPVSNLKILSQSCTFYMIVGFEWRECLCLSSVRCLALSGVSREGSPPISFLIQ